jgi:hypothetical protein
MVGVSRLALKIVVMTREQGTGNREQGTGNRCYATGTGKREEGTGKREQGRGKRFWATLLFVTYVSFFRSPT